MIARARGHWGRVIAMMLLSLATVSPLPVHAQAVQYERPVEVAPQPEAIGGGYTTPDVQRPRPRHYWLEIADVFVLAGAMALALWLVVRRRSRPLALALSVGSLAYFGFYREGCICPIGSIQNVAVALTDPGYAIPIVVTAVFFLPLLVAVFYGRVFCGGVCPLGAIQEIVLLKPVQVPRRLDAGLGLLKYVYLGLAVALAIQPAIARDFVICRFDPFVGFFRRDGFAHMMAVGSGFLVLGMFVGRPYCRYLCPYGALLAWCSRLAARGVSITPAQELDCGLCATACPYGAISRNRAVRKDCLYCARCYASCPCETRVGAAV
jgi:polyferredoxin